MATVLLAIGGALGTAGVALLGWRLWRQVRQLQQDVLAVGTEFTRVAAARDGLLTVVRSQQKAHDG